MKNTEIEFNADDFIGVVKDVRDRVKWCFHFKRLGPVDGLRAWLCLKNKTVHYPSNYLQFQLPAVHI